jgi:hypothetical protein
MVKLVNVLIFLSLVIPNIIWGQISETVISANNIKYDLSIRLNTAFSLGIEGGLHILLKEKAKDKPKKKKGEEFLLKKKHQYQLHGRVGIEGGAQTFIGINNHYGITLRATRNENTIRNISFSPLGYFISIYGETYSVNESGEVKKKNLSGRLYYSPSFSYSFGKSSKLDAFESWFIRYNYTFLIRYNTSILPMFNLAFGYNLK